MKDQNNINQLALHLEIRAVIETANEAKKVRSNDQKFLKQVSLLLNRIYVMEALFNETELCSSDALKYLAGQATCNECD